jgi:hypothetical protein
MASIVVSKRGVQTPWEKLLLLEHEDSLEFFIAPETFVGVKPDEEEEYCFNGPHRIKIDKSKHVVCVICNGARSFNCRGSSN